MFSMYIYFHMSAVNTSLVGTVILKAASNMLILSFIHCLRFVGY
jgi:hypothetical protein